MSSTRPERNQLGTIDPVSLVVQGAEGRRVAALKQQACPVQGRSMGSGGSYF